MWKGPEPAASIPRASNTGSCGQAEQPSASQLLSPVPKSPSRSNSTAKELNKPRPTSSRPKSPAYLQGKNPYGEILDKVEHSYKAWKPTATGPPSQLGSSIECRPRTSGSFKFTARPMLPESEQTVAAPAAQPPLWSTRQTPTPVSVQAARNFFESKASQSRTAPRVPPEVPPAIAKGTAADLVIKDPKPQATSVQWSKEEGARLTRIPSPSNEHTPMRKYSDPSSPIPRPALKVVKRVDASKRTNPFVRQQPKRSMRTATAPKDDAKPASSSPSAGALREQKTASRSRSINVIEEPLRAANPVVNNQQVVDGPSGEGCEKSSQFEPSEDSVRRQSTWKPLIATKTDETIASEDPKRPEKTQCSEAARDVRKEYNCRQGPTTGSGVILLRHSDSPKPAGRPKESRSAPLAQQEPADISEPQYRRECTNSITRDLDQEDMETFVHNFGEPTKLPERLDHTTANGLSHDFPNSHHNHSRRASAPGAVPTTDPIVHRSYYTNHFPYYVDSRTGYGRRKTNDFGFPGARFKPRRTFRTYQPLQNPGSWIKQLCGHFSYVATKEVQKEVSLQSCRQCRAKHPPPPRTPLDYHKTPHRGSTDSSVASTSSSKKGDRACCQYSRRSQHRSKCVPSNECGATFAKDLGTIIDAILEEHSNSLGNVISNIRSSQPPHENLQGMSGDPVQQTQSRGTSSKTCWSTCQHSRENSTSCTLCCHQQVRRPVYRPVYQHSCLPIYRSDHKETCQSPSQTICKHVPPCLYVPPKSAEKLNVGKPGQVGPNLNDSRESLRETTTSMTDLIDLVKSAADDLGIDLEERPSAQEEEKFLGASVEPTPSQFVIALPSVRHETVEEKMQFLREHSWLQRTLTRFTELSEPRSHLMVEHELIDRDVLNKSSITLTRESNCLQNRSTDPVVVEVPKIVDEEINQTSPSRVLTRIFTQPRCISGITQGSEDDEPIQHMEILQWLDVAQTELPAAINSLNDALNPLPTGASVTEPDMPKHEFKVSYEQKYEPEYESEYEPEYEDYEPVIRTDTEPTMGLQDYMANLEYQPSKASVASVSKYSEEKSPDAYRA
jgi:hypothetical protein